ncbi:DUF4173 domain-containing protein [Nocardioides sp. B-3]|uniref:DUF4173 domain-containing protein n=1 Tax=Nocardioides sp. B-3 TaxID=2895565 RepID=UPI002153246E|nr:DUF4173 domain-containing protein [Nocardioides sp. B-3]UUZ58988.1 DUF4173 domain-containing protein [Nocardioides sp. B-3]
MRVLGLASINPDARVAGRNIDRYEATDNLDLHYLQSLSSDAAPVIAERLPADVAACALRELSYEDFDSGQERRPLDWNRGRSRAEEALADPDMEATRFGTEGNPCDAIIAAYMGDDAG